jgi:hypothetical protein
MKLLRIVAVAALTAFGGITGGTCIVHATPATGVLLGAPAVKTLQTPTMGALPVEKAYYYYRRHYWHPYYHRHYYHRHYWHRRYWHRRYW